MHMHPDLAYERVDVAEMRAIAQRAPGDRVFVEDFDHTRSGVNDRIALGHDGSFYSSSALFNERRGRCGRPFGQNSGDSLS